MLCLLLAGCGASSTPGPTPEDWASPGDATSASSPSPTSSPAAKDSPSAAPPGSPSREPAGTKIITAHSDFGPILYDASGQPIYLFDAEATSRPMCYGECANAWPPVLTNGKPHAAGAVKSELLGTTRRRDGSTQITYAGHPLYFYAHEGKYQVLCHNVIEFGGTWLVVKPNGRPASS
jgi:predicted lipoprotein with Yx(FWY)xxD motif